MGKVTILNETTKNPLDLIGQVAASCWNAPDEYEKNIKRAWDCIDSDHGRTEEFPDVLMVIDGFSAKVVREIYTHIIGVSRLQASTRYIDYSNFGYIIPNTVYKNKDALLIYQREMSSIRKSITKLIELGIPKEDATMLLPFGSETKFVLKINLRSLIHMFHKRKCNRAFWEFREFMDLTKDELKKYSDEWELISNKLFVPQCKHLGYCPEKQCCGIAIKKEDAFKILEKASKKKVKNETNSNN